MHARISASAAKNVARRASIRSRTSDISTFCSIVAIPVTNPPGTVSVPMVRIAGASRVTSPGARTRNRDVGDRSDRLLRRHVGRSLVWCSQVHVAVGGEHFDDLAFVLD